MKTNKKLEQLVSKIDSVQKLIDRLDTLSEKMSEDWGNMPTMQLLEEAAKEESVYAADGRILISGLEHQISWSFEEIVKFWKSIYGYDDEGNALKNQAAEYRRLADMLEK